MTGAPLAWFDTGVAAAIHALRGDALTAVARIVTATGGTIATIVAVAALVSHAWARRKRGDAVLAVAIVSGGMLVSTLVKWGAGRLRPPAAQALVELPSSASLPSGHSMASFLVAVAISHAVLASGLSRPAKVVWVAVAVAWAAAVGVSRVYLGVHWPSDVVASWLLGGVWAVVVLWLAGRAGQGGVRPPAEA